MGSGARTITKGRTEERVLGLDAFEKISAVEGVHLTPEMRLDLEAISSSRMSAAERTRFISEKYGKTSA